MKKFVVGPALAALAMFFFGFLYWAVGPLPRAVIQKTANDAAAGQALLQHFPASGAYMVPAEGGPEFEKLHVAGPIATVHIRTRGAPLMAPGNMALGYLQFFVSALLLALVYHRTAAAIDSYRCRVGLSVMIGLIIAVYSAISNAIWWLHPWPLPLVTALYDVFNWLIAGLVLAKFAAPAPAAAPAAA